jgi:hypothetical protein
MIIRKIVQTQLSRDNHMKDYAKFSIHSSWVLVVEAYA